MTDSPPHHACGRVRARLGRVRTRLERVQGSHDVSGNFFWVVTVDIDGNLRVALVKWHALLIDVEQCMTAR